MRNTLKRTLLLCTIVLAVACAPQYIVVDAGQPCNADSFAVVDGFAGARRGTCRVQGRERVLLEIRREDENVTNPSPWFAFKLVPDEPVAATVILDYDTWKHRYWPKLSYDGINWTRLDESDVDVFENSGLTEIRIELGEEPVWVAAQEIILPAHYDIWRQRIASSGNAQAIVLGKSVNEHPLHALDTGGNATKYVLLIGRQHPPEVSSVFAYLAFAETVLSNSDLATEFRERYRVIAVPLMNPDGVIGGNWRHNLGGLDLNRDWGNFTQPETRAVGELVDRMESGGVGLAAFLDFHSTQRNLFYTHAPDQPTDPPRFAYNWFDAVQARTDYYEFEHVDRKGENMAVAKNYFYSRFGVPAYTYEVGDETDRKAAQDAAVVFAEEFMKQLLLD